MNSNLLTLIDRFAGCNVLVIGEAMLDTYTTGEATRLSPDAPVPVVRLCSREDAPGGAANTAANAAALGASVGFLSVTGEDEDAALLRQALGGRGVVTDGMIAHLGRRTLVKQRVVAGGQTLLRLDQGSAEPLDAEHETILIDRLAALWGHCDAVLISDYGYGILTPRVIEAVAALQRRAPRVLTVDAKNLSLYQHVGVTAVKPNYAQAATLLRLQLAHHHRMRVQQLASEAERLLELTGARVVAVTLDTDGALIIERDAPPYRTYAGASGQTHPAGAGDTFLTAFALALVHGAETAAAAEIASAAAAVVVERAGTTVCAAADLRVRIAGTQKHAPDLAALLPLLQQARARGQRIVFTNGCFDILHRGHITYLNRAKALGDLLVVGVNSDASVRRLKGLHRPINSVEDRVHVLSALSCVDHIVTFAQDTPEELIRALRPDIFVKGGDYTRETLPEAALVESLGGCVQILAYVEDRSTTGMIERIRAGEARSLAPLPGGTL